MWEKSPRKNIIFPFRDSQNVQLLKKETLVAGLLSPTYLKQKKKRFDEIFYGFMRVFSEN